MKTQIYLQGSESSDGKTVVCPLTSSCVIFFLRYCQTEQFDVTFISTQVSKQDVASCCELSLSAFSGISVSFLPWDKAPDVVRKVSLPSVHQEEASLVRAGLCVVIRHVIKAAHAERPSAHLVDLLGFRQGSMRMCAEVSGWTKLCEVELPESISLLIESLKMLKKQQKAYHVDASPCLTLPLHLLKLEGHFQKKCRVHNDDKKRRAELVRLREMMAQISHNQMTNGEDGQSGAEENMESRFRIMSLSAPSEKSQAHEARVERTVVSESQLLLEHVVFLPHGVRRVRTVKHLGKEHEDSSKETTEETTADPVVYGGAPTVTSELMSKLTYLDIEFIHTYSEGPEMTLADLILFVYKYFMLSELNFTTAVLSDHLPSILTWLRHMASLATIQEAGIRLGWEVPRLAKGQMSRLTNTEVVVVFELPEETADQEEEDMELSRCAQMKHKAIKPEVFQAFKKLELAGISAVTGHHPCGDDVTVDWENLPDGVHPRCGDVPEKRTRRKCQQLENLVTAVQAVARPGDTIIDFCCGGGHLGIVLAHLLPDCQIYLVENKEESLFKVCSRLESLALRNVTLFQSNIDYYKGDFDIGVCLHACGSATDMVLQLCLDARASFVICPCCYGSIHKTHLLTYPRSKQFQNSALTYKDFLTLGHAADQTEFNITLESQGRKCMNLVDSDRAAYARELGYNVTLCSLHPLSCTPKNNLLVGTLNL